MADAYKCDLCGEFKQGTPAEEFYRKGFGPKNETSYLKALDACDGCWPPDGAEQPSVEDETMDDPDPVEPDESPQNAHGDPEEASTDTPVVVIDDGAGGREEREYNADDEPYFLPRDGTIDDMEWGVIYAARIMAVKKYGFFVKVLRTPGRDNQVTGLVHQSNLGLQKPADFNLGDTVHVELENIEDDETFSFIPHGTDRDDIDDALFPANEVNL